MMAPPNERYLFLKERIKDIALSSHRVPEDILLITVSKMHSVNELLKVYRAGCRDFGENRIQEALKKIPQCPKDIHWHLIGSLQSNKVNKAVSSFHLIQSIDTPHLAKKISEQSVKFNVTTSILLQVNTSGEPQKHGLDAEGWRRHLEEIEDYPNIELKGLMTIAPLTEDRYTIQTCFAHLRELKEEFTKEVKNPSFFYHLSMGMSHDYDLAIQEGATMLRIGSAIFQFKE